MDRALNVLLVFGRCCLYQIQFSSQLGLDNSLFFKICRYSSASSDLDFQMSKSCRSSVVSVGLRPLKNNRVLNL